MHLHVKHVWALATAVTLLLAFCASLAKGQEPDRPPAATYSVVAHLSGLTLQQRANAHIEIEPLGKSAAQSLGQMRQIEALWNSGNDDAALTLLATLEAVTSLGLGILWRKPHVNEGGIAGFGDVIIGPDDATGAIALDIHRPSGNIFCVVQVATGWNLYRSSTEGTSWVNTYSWSGAGGVVDVDAVVVGDLVYIAYASEEATNELRARRATTISGAIDLSYDAQLVNDFAPQTVQEIACASNADGASDTIYICSRTSANRIAVHLDFAGDGTTWTNDSPTTPHVALAGFDGAFNTSGEWFLWIAIGNSFSTGTSGDSFINVLRRNSTTWQLLPIAIGTFLSGVPNGSIASNASISFHENKGIVAYNRTIVDKFGSPTARRLDCALTTDGGTTWAGLTSGQIVAINVTGEHDVTARGNAGFAATYISGNTIRFRRKSTYAGAWGLDIPVNDFPAATAPGLEPEVNWLAPVNGSSTNFRYGIVYAQPDPAFDRRDHCEGDVNLNGGVNVDDLLAIISGWGQCAAPCPPSCSGDITPLGGNCNVNIDDLLEVVTAWGPCP